MCATSGPETLDKPRILCLHGAGVSAAIFALQARRLIAHLAPYFRLVFVNGPYLSELPKDLRPFYGEIGPCYRWSAWLPHHIPDGDGSTVVEEIEYSLRVAMAADHGTGEWIGLLGFSQGARLAFSILLENQLREREQELLVGDDERFFAGVNWKFGILLAGGPIPFSLSHRTEQSPYYEQPGTAPMHSFSIMDEPDIFDFPDKLAKPTLHVHGMQDGDLPLHQTLQRNCVEPDRAVLLEWNGDHRVPVQVTDVKAVTEGIFQVFKMSAANNA